MIPIKCSQCGASMEKEGECIYCGSHFRVLGKAPSIARSPEGFAGGSEEDFHDEDDNEVYMYNNILVSNNDPEEYWYEKPSIFKRIKEWIF